jgi:hypothetical protein
MSAIRIAHDLDNAKYFAIFLELEFCSPTPPIKKLCGITLQRAAATSGLRLAVG